MREDRMPLHIEQTILEAGQAIHYVSLVRSGKSEVTVEGVREQLLSAHEGVKQVLEHMGDYLAQGKVSDEQIGTLHLVDHQLQNAEKMLEETGDQSHGR